MHGRWVTQMAILQSRCTGLRIRHLQNGNSRAPLLVLHSSIMHTMANGSAKLYSRSSNALELRIRSVHPIPSIWSCPPLTLTKVGHVTCDNASNNPTMMKELAAHLKTAMGKKYSWKKRKIKCVGFLSSLISVTHKQQLSCTCNQFGNTNAHLNVQQVTTF